MLKWNITHKKHNNIAHKSRPNLGGNLGPNTFLCLSYGKKGIVFVVTPTGTNPTLLLPSLLITYLSTNNIFVLSWPAKRIRYLKIREHCTDTLKKTRLMVVTGSKPIYFRFATTVK